MSYPVTIAVAPRVEDRSRITVACRPLIALPHALLVGPLWFARIGASGLLGAAAGLLAVVNWCAIVFASRDLEGIRQFQLYYLRWRVRALSYMALFVDDYPPFGDAAYPAGLDVRTPVGRDRTSVAFRVLLALPHLLLLCLLLAGWVVVTIVAWFVILFTRRYPVGLQPFALGCFRWLVRVEAYLLLLVDEYPPFTLT
jgi:hypothetical protein